MVLQTLLKYLYLILRKNKQLINIFIYLKHKKMTKCNEEKKFIYISYKILKKA